MAKALKTQTLAFRHTESVVRQFNRKAAPLGGVSTVLREFVDAFLENRMTIDPNPNRKSLYDNRKQD